MEPNVAGRKREAHPSLRKMEDLARRKVLEEVVKEGKPHNGLDDAMLEAECLSRIVYGKNLLEKFLRSDVPKYLQNKI